MSTIAFAISGVLRAEVGSGIIHSGMRLYKSIIDHGFTVELLSDSMDTASDNHWLSVNGFYEHAHVLAAEVVDDDLVATRLRQAKIIRADLQSDLQFIVDHDLRVIEAAFTEGIPCLAFLLPKYQRPEFRPDFSDKPRAWDDVVAEVDRQREMKAKDHRVRDA